MIAGYLETVLMASARDYPVVTVTGPVQYGKTILVRGVFAKHAYVSLESPDDRAFALEDPRGFLNQFSGKVILDEVQRAPDLFSYIQGIVDEKEELGQFILTGSNDVLLLQQVTQSLAGRTSIFHLLPLSRAELDPFFNDVVEDWIVGDWTQAPAASYILGLQPREFIHWIPSADSR